FRRLPFGFPLSLDNVDERHSNHEGEDAVGQCREARVSVFVFPDDADCTEDRREPIHVRFPSVDGRPRQKYSTATDPEARPKDTALRERSRATVLAAVERGGRIKATVVPSRRG